MPPALGHPVELFFVCLLLSFGVSKVVDLARDMGMSSRYAIEALRLAFYALAAVNLMLLLGIIPS
jgi:hypothetical protein